MLASFSSYFFELLHCWAQRFRAEQSPVLALPSKQSHKGTRLAHSYSKDNNAGTGVGGLDLAGRAKEVFLEEWSCLCSSPLYPQNV